MYVDVIRLYRVVFWGSLCVGKDRLHVMAPTNARSSTPSLSSEKRMVDRGDGKKTRYLRFTWFTTSRESGATTTITTEDFIHRK